MGVLREINEKLNELWREYVEEFGDLNEPNILDIELRNGTTPNDWIEEGLTPDEYEAWARAGGFNARQVKKLIEANIEAKDAGRRVTWYEVKKLKLPSNGSIAYLYCNGDLNDEILQQLIKKEHLNDIELDNL